MTSTPYMAFAFLEQLFAFINNQNKDIAKLLKIFLQYTKHFSNSAINPASACALYVYCGLETVQEQTQSTRSLKLTYHRQLIC